MIKHNLLLLADAAKGAGVEEPIDYAIFLFRATQTEEKLRRENIQGKAEANRTHYQVGAKVRQTIKELGGTMPEDLPTAESILLVEKKKKQLESSKKSNHDTSELPEQ